MNFNTLPLWIRIFVITFAVIALPAAAVTLTAGDRAAVVDQFVAERYIQEVTETRQITIEQDLRLARGNLRDLLTNPYYQEQIVNLLTEDATDEALLPVTNLFQTWLVDGAYYYRVTLYNADGDVIASTEDNITPLTPSIDGETVRLAAGFQAGRDAGLLGEQQRLIVYNEGNIPAVDVAQVVYAEDTTTPIGYLVGTLNTDRVFLANIPVIGDFIPLTSYLVTQDGLLIAPPQVRDSLTRLADAEGISSALDGNSGVVNFTLNNREVVSSYAPISGTRFALITETTGSVFIGETLGLFAVNTGIITLVILALVGMTTWFLNRLVAYPLRRLQLGMATFNEGDFTTPLPYTSRPDEIGELAQEISRTRQLTRELISDLEQRLALRTRDLQATQAISSYVAAQRDLQKLMDDVVTRIVEVFPNIYHAQVFLLNEERSFAILRSSTGEPGRQLLQRGHRLAVGSLSVIGQVTAEGRTIAAFDTARSEVHRRNEFLPDTQAELAIPLRVGQTIIGALDVQSKQSETFSDDQITVLEIMADQIAISIDNARLYQELLRRVEENTLNTRNTTYRTWMEYLYDQRTKMLSRASGMQTPTEVEPLREEALMTGETVVGNRTERNTIPIFVPIVLRGQVLGVVEWELAIADFNQEKVELAKELVSRLSVSLDNARLFQQSQRTAERERVVNTIAAQLTGQTDVDQILQTAVREVGRALRVPEVKIRLHFDTTTNGANGHSNGNSTEDPPSAGS